jgi:hypothetical protein
MQQLRRQDDQHPTRMAYREPQERAVISTYTGGCHCGGLRFEAELDLSAGTIKCNCSYCVKSRFWLARTEPENFRASGEAKDYRGGNPVAHHFFCPQCGVHVYDRIDAPNSLGRAYVNVSVACIEDVDVDALIAAPVRYCDGLHDDWASTPKETRHL